MSNSNSEVTLMSIPQILEVMPISKSKFWLMVQKDEFPKPIKIGRSSLAETRAERGFWLEFHRSTKPTAYAIPDPR